MTCLSESSGHSCSISVLCLLTCLNRLTCLRYISKWSSHVSICNCAGLLGGAVYVNAFTLITRHVDPVLEEFSLAAASLGDSLGIAFADIGGALLQVKML